MFWKLFRKAASSELPEASPPEAEAELPHCGSRIRVTVFTDAGRIREDNEDNFFISGIGSRPSPQYSGETELDGAETHLFAVFDGMGGEAYGAEAAAIAAQTMQELSAEMTESTDPQDFMRRFIRLANEGICRMIQQKQCGCSGSTAACVMIQHGTVWVFHVGDSRVYSHDADGLSQITEDQTLAMKKLKANIYTEQEAKESPDAHKITSYLGVDQRGVGVSYLSYDAFPLKHQTLLLCSDGLTDMCTDAEIAEILAQGQTHPAQKLAEQALQNGGEDNVTCIVIQSV